MRRFPPPWQVVEIPDGYKVTDRNGFQLAYVDHRAEEMMRADHLSPAEAEKIARAIARLPESLMGRRRRNRRSHPPRNKHGE